MQIKTKPVSCLFQTSQTGGQQYSDTSPFSIPWFPPTGTDGRESNVEPRREAAVAGAQPASRNGG